MKEKFEVEIDNTSLGYVTVKGVIETKENPSNIEVEIDSIKDEELKDLEWTEEQDEEILDAIFDMLYFGQLTL